MSDESSVSNLDEAIRDSHARVRRHDQLVNQRYVLTDLRDAVQDRVASYERSFAAEQRDVERLERGGFAKLIADLVGGRETRLATERVEAEAAWQKLEGERSRLTYVSAQLTELQHELAALGDARSRYDFAIKRKAQQLAESGDPRGHELESVHTEFMTVDTDLREHGEAHRAGMVAGGVIMRMDEHLGHALGASRKDVLSEVAPLTPYSDYYKHQHTKAADELAWEGQRALDEFSRELADIGVEASIQLPTVSTRWFADAFVDNIVLDWSRHKRLKQSLAEVDAISEWLVAMVQWLKQRCDDLTERRDALASRRDQLLAEG